MKHRPLVLDGTTRIETKRVVEFAEKHRLDTRSMEMMAKGTMRPIGDNPNYTCVVPVGYRCVLSIDEQPKLGWCRHLSVSVLGDGEAPNVAAVNMLLKEFGFNCAIQPDEFRKLEPGFRGGWPHAVWIENIDDGKVAINVLQKL